MSQPNILIVKLSAIGDVVHTLPALNAIRHCYPDAHISWLVEEASANLIIGHPALDQVIVSGRKRWIDAVKQRQWQPALGEMATFIKTLRRRRYDMLLDFQFSLKSAVLIAMCRAGRKIGFGKGLAHQEHSHLFLNERIPAVSMDIHAIDRGLLMLKAIGIEAPTLAYRLPVTAEHKFKARSLLEEWGLSIDAPFIAVNPMAKWETKLWEQHKFARTVDAIEQTYRIPVVFTGGPEDIPYIEAILDQMTSKAPNLAGRTDLLTLAAVLARATLMVTTDTGPMHIAAAVDTPTVALFGPTAPWRTGPYGSGHRVIQVDKPCRPCFKRQCDKAISCMQAIEIDAVIAGVEDILSKADFQTAGSRNVLRSQ